MKAVVLEIKNGEAAVLKKDGQVIRVPRHGLSVGDILDIDDNPVPAGRFSPALRRRILNTCAAAASAALILGLGGGYWYTSVAACSYVSLDINPSIEYILNRRDQVIDIEALNDDASDIVDTLLKSGVIKSGLTEALQETAGLLESEGYIASDSDTDYILVNVSSGSKKSAKLLKKEVSAAFKELNKEYEDSLSLTLTESSPSERKKANELGISAGEYHEIKTIREHASESAEKDIDRSVVKKYQDFNVRELLDASRSLKEPGGASRESENTKKAGQNTEQNSGVSSKDSTAENAGSFSADSKKDSGTGSSYGSSKDDSTGTSASRDEKSESSSGAQSGTGSYSNQEQNSGQKSGTRKSSDSAVVSDGSGAGSGNSSAGNSNTGTGNSIKGSGNSGTGTGNSNKESGASGAGTDNSNKGSGASGTGTDNSNKESGASGTGTDNSNKESGASGTGTGNSGTASSRSGSVSDSAGFGAGKGSGQGNTEDTLNAEPGNGTGANAPGAGGGNSVGEGAQSSGSPAF